MGPKTLETLGKHYATLEEQKLKSTEPLAFKEQLRRQVGGSHENHERKEAGNA